MPRREWSRRDVLRECLAAGVLAVPAGWAEADVLHAWIDAQAQRQPTAHVEMGPFYKRKAPATTKLRMPGDKGLALAVSGRVLSVHGEPVRGATVEVWQADDGGLYDIDGYRFRATIAPPPSGAYAFDSIMPGHYPARVARHVHYFVTAPGFKPLTTQLYFATDEVFQGNVDKNFSKDPLITSRTLVRPVSLSGKPEATLASVEFELVLEKA
jgi:protocatechuate 3,4-dioxygenase beta subunit